MKNTNTQTKPEDNPIRLKIIQEFENLDANKQQLMQALIKGKQTTFESIKFSFLY